MNAENFSEVIKNPSKLYQIPYQELKSLAMQYPYCRNLYYLLLTKLLQSAPGEQQRFFDNVLEKTATLSIDRHYLYLQMRALQDSAEQSESFELAEEYLELRDLSKFSADLDPIAVNVLPQEEENANNSNGNSSSTNDLKDLFVPETGTPPPLEDDLTDFEADVFQTPQSDSFEPGAVLDLTEPATEKMDQQASPAFHPDDQLMAACAALLTILDTRTPVSTPQTASTLPSAVSPLPGGWPVEAIASMVGLLDRMYPPAAPRKAGAETAPEKTIQDRPAPKPKSSFRSWVKQFQPSHIQPHLDELMESGKSAKAPKKKKKKKKDKIIAFAEQSLIENEEVATETLAELLVSQERYDKAIRVYERLCLIFPEKSGFFAEKIEKLKKQL